jgi:hypothetical protein
LEAVTDPNCPNCGGYHVRATQCPEYQPTSNELLDQAYAYAKTWGTPELASRCVNDDCLNLDPLRKALAEAWLAGHQIARLADETS